MFDRLRQRGSDESGFTLIELLVVILIIGILAAIAIPSFLNQKSKANDASAIELARTAETTAETIATDNNGQYGSVTAANLNSYEPTIPIVSSTANAFLVGATGSATGYTVTAQSTDGNTFSVVRQSNGNVIRSCSASAAAPANGGCVAGSW